MHDSPGVYRSDRRRMLGREFEAPQPCLLGRDVAGESEHIARGASQHVGGMLTLTPPMIDLRSKRIGCDRRPDRFCSSLNELRARHLDLRRALVQLDCNRLNIRHKPAIRHAHAATDRDEPTSESADKRVRHSAQWKRNGGCGEISRCRITARRGQSCLGKPQGS